MKVANMRKKHNDLQSVEDEINNWHYEGGRKTTQKLI